MVIGIIAAMEEELERFLKDVQLEDKTAKARMTFYKGTYCNTTVVAVVCGIGKVNSAVCTEILASEYHVDKIINVGVAGGIKKNICPGDIVIADNLVQHDMDTSAFGDELGQIPRLETFDFKCDSELADVAEIACKEIGNINWHRGRIVSGDQFIADNKKLQWLEKQFGAAACEMEGASIAQVCFLNSIPFIVIRSISDNANSGAHMDYEKFVPIAVENSTKLLKKMIKMF